MNATPQAIHVPVLPREILHWGKPAAGQAWADGTAGAGGHSRLLWSEMDEQGVLLAIDRDPAAAERLVHCLPEPIRILNASYHLLPDICDMHGLDRLDGILLDLGLSSDQLADRDRGFSFQTDGELDMRFDPTTGQPAWQWLSSVDEKSIADAIYQYGEERFSRRIARRIVEARRTNPIRTASQLRDLIHRCIPQARKATTGNPKHGRIDPATRTFQALRIVVNEELVILDQALRVLPDLLGVGGRLLVISFHSLEDRIVKRAFREDPRLEVLTRKPVQATEEEIGINPRARSAKLRVAARVAQQ